jgi:hypothetical protein
MTTTTTTMTTSRRKAPHGLHTIRRARLLGLDCGRRRCPWDKALSVSSFVAWPASCYNPKTLSPVRAFYNTRPVGETKIIESQLLL